MVALVSVLLTFAPLPFPFIRLILEFIAAGFLSVWIYKRRTGQPLTLANGARLGWITGIFCFTLVTVQLTAAVVAASSEGGFASLLKQQMSPGDQKMAEALKLFEEPSAMAIMMLFVLFFLFVLLTLLPIIGGLLGAKVLAREQ